MEAYVSLSLSELGYFSEQEFCANEYGFGYEIEKMDAGGVKVAQVSDRLLGLDNDPAIRVYPLFQVLYVSSSL